MFRTLGVVSMRKTPIPKRNWRFTVHRMDHHCGISLYASPRPILRARFASGPPLPLTVAHFGHQKRFELLRSDPSGLTRVWQSELETPWRD